MLELNEKGYAVLAGDNLDFLVARFVRAFQAAWEGVSVLPGDSLEMRFTLKVLPEGELEPVPVTIRSWETP